MEKAEYEPSKEELAEEIKSLKTGSIDYVSPEEFKSAKQKGLRRAISRLEVSSRAGRYRIKKGAKPTAVAVGKSAFSLGKVLEKGISDFYDSIPPEGMSKAEWDRKRAKQKKMLLGKSGGK